MADPRYYLIPRALVHAALAGLLALLLGLGLAAWLFAPVWLGQLGRSLDADAPLADPDAIVLNTRGESDAAAREAAQRLRDGRTAVAVVGRPFSFDDLTAASRNLRIDQLVRHGAPRDRVVEVPHGEDLYEEMTALRAVAVERGWRRVLLYADGLGSRRTLLIARRTLGEAGIEVGQRTFSDGWIGPDNWWQDARGRSIVLFNLMSLLVTLASGRA